MNDELKRQKRTEARQRRIAKKLTEMGLTAEDFELYKKLFVFGWRRWIRRKIEWKDWVTVDRFPLNDETILSHLLRKEWVGSMPPFRGGWIQVLIVDLDCHQARAARSLRKRLAVVLKAFEPSEPFLIQSSASGGVHVVYLLDRPRRCAEVLRVATEMIEGAGGTVKDGHIELYPQ
ncbi:MAG: hypothetical protein EXS64_07395, partial [Candidatus Latescibacteria bacterium]|nr:hypothetical protein [Candidatus Latescibacterota bacterium]